MRIHQVTNPYIKGFTAILECETCGHTGEVTSEWGDKFFRDSCIPQMTCVICGCDASGNVPDRAPDVRPPSV
jgi:hypothetical protein